MPHGFKPLLQENCIYVQRILVFLFYSYVKSRLDNDSCLPIYKTIPVICNTPRQTQCVRNSIFPLFVMVITCCGPSCGLWLCAGALNRGCTKIFRKLLRRRNHSSGNITRRPDNYSNYFLIFLTFAGLWPRVLRHSIYLVWTPACPTYIPRHGDSRIIICVSFKNNVSRNFHFKKICVTSIANSSYNCH
jgi:hypothetical protein